MINSIQSLSSTPLQIFQSKAAQTPIEKLFHVVVGGKKPDFTLRPLWNHPGQAVLGVVWAAWWAYSAYLAAASAVALGREITAQPREDWTKIGDAAKKAFLNQISFVGSSAFVAYWAHEAKLLSLGRYADMVNAANYACSFIYNGVEGAAAAYDMYQEKEAVLNAQSSQSAEEHKKKFFLGTLKLASSVTMVAWAVLGIGAIAAGVALTSWITMPLLGAGFGLAVLSIIYEIRLDEEAKPTTPT
jgi:hypothetical protein